MGPTIRTGPRIARSARLRLSCTAAVFQGERILVTRRADNGRWCLPGGGIDSGETVAESCCREVLEETGLVIEIERLIGIYSDPNRIFVYPDNAWHVVELLFAAKAAGGSLRTTAETTEARFFTREDTASLDLLEHDAERLADVFAGNTAAFIR